MYKPCHQHDADEKGNCIFDPFGEGLGCTVAKINCKVRNMNKYDVVTLHFSNECNMHCPFCYSDKGLKPKPFDFWYSLIPNLSRISKQVALGGGEPLMHPGFVNDFAYRCSHRGLTCNVTTNGLYFKTASQEEINDVCENLSLVVMSFDKYKIHTLHRYDEFKQTVKKLHKAKVRVGVNLLIDTELTKIKTYTAKGKKFKVPALFGVLQYLYGAGVERVFGLAPKSTMVCYDILEMKKWLDAATKAYGTFFVDDCTFHIVTEKKYREWSEPCHYLHKGININCDGTVTGCSFDPTPLMKIEKPEDVLMIPTLRAENKYYCPYLHIQSGDKIVEERKLPEVWEGKTN